MARLAGVPRSVLTAARTYLDDLEARSRALRGPGPQGELRFDAPAAKAVAAPDSGSAAAGAAALRHALQSVDPDSLSPREALDALYRLKALLANDP